MFRRYLNIPYIYKITNDVNGKIYIGKTYLSIQERFKQHCLDSKKSKNHNRPLYKAMNKYGTKHFHIEKIEYCFPNEENEKEKYWIKFYNSFHYGYNATKGGDGKTYIDRNVVIKAYQKTQNCKKVAEILNISVDSVRTILRDSKIKIIPSQQYIREEYSKNVVMLSKNGEKLKIFFSLGDAARFIQEGNTLASQNFLGIKAHIREACNKKRKTAYQFKWNWYE